jgi:CRP/FNR family transcriptional regulator, polysaccharide utilization system transcription regulator
MTIVIFRGLFSVYFYCYGPVIAQIPASKQMKTILVIDEDPMMRENTTEILELSHYQVIAEKSQSRGLKIALDRRPDLIIYDDILPNREGIELLGKIRKKAGLDNIPLILIVDRADELDKVRWLSDGASEYLAKPFLGKELLHVVAKHLSEVKS